MYKNNPAFFLFKRIVTVTLLLPFLLAACSRSSAILEIDPTFGCRGSMGAQLSVTWDVRSLGLDSVLVKVNNLGEAEKLWFEAGEVGSRQTGPGWAGDGFTVTLRAKDGTRLARRTFVHHVCETQ